MTRLTRTFILAAASVGLVTAAAASSAAAAPTLDARQITQARESAAIATWAKQNGLSGLSPASLHSVSVAAPQATVQHPRDVFATVAVPRYARDVFADIP
jgi:hypothetical protein